MNTVIVTGFMQPFPDYLAEKQVPDALGRILEQLTDGSKTIYAALQSGKEGKTGGVNVTGDQQVAMDVFSNDLLVDVLKKNGSVSLIASEELDEPLETGDEGYTVVMDPLDGSSLADVNLAVGTIVGVYKGKGILGKKGRDQVAALALVYGPRLTFLVTTGDGVDEFLYHPDRDIFQLHRAALRMGSKGKIMAPGNVKIAHTDPWYFRLLETMAKDGYALRYSGGMVPDVNQIILKGGGVYMYPGSSEKPEGKLRLLYECAPLAFLVEQAGGKAVANEADILDVEIREYHQRTPVFIGSSHEVQLARAAFHKG